MRKTNREKSKFTGVYPYNKYKWASCISMKGKVVRLGVYDTEWLAHCAYESYYDKLSDEQRLLVLNKIKNYE